LRNVAINIELRENQRIFQTIVLGLIFCQQEDDVDLHGHRGKKWKPLPLSLGILAVCFVSQAFSISGPDEPPEFMIKDDRIKIMKNDPLCSPCVIFSSLKILGKDVAGARASIMVEITGHWTSAKDCRYSNLPWFQCC
jgi:hypothetical protein